MEKELDNQYVKFLLTMIATWVLGVVLMIVAKTGEYNIIGHVIMWGSIFTMNIGILIKTALDYLKDYIKKWG